MDGRHWRTTGASLCQFSDSSEQRSFLNMEMTLTKAELTAMKNELSLNCKKIPTGIMLLIRKVWLNNFGRVKKNQKSIRERGYLPRDRTLLKNPEIRVIVVQDEKLEEISMLMRCKNESDNDSSLEDELPMTDVSCLPKERRTSAILNFQSGFT